MNGTLNEDTLDDVIYEIGTKAKEMEKEQIIDAYDEGYGIRDAYGDCFDNQIAEQYYNQIYDEFLTFKSEEDDSKNS